MAADSISISNVYGLMSDHINRSITDENSFKDFSANCNSPMSTSMTPGTTQFAILYKGSMCVYDGIPPEKVHEIMLIAAASAKSTEMKSGIPYTSLIPTRPSSPQGTSNNLPSPQSISFPVDKTPICRLRGEFPLARRQSLQMFLEKRKIRLGSKAPYTSSTEIEKNLCADNTQEFPASFN